MLADVGEKDSDSNGGGVAQQDEEDLVEGMLRQVGIDPHHIGQVLDLAAVGIVNSAWRNGPVEDWHVADGLLTDGAMLRINTHTTWRVREIIRRWRIETCLAPKAPSTLLGHYLDRRPAPYLEDVPSSVELRWRPGDH